MNRMRVIAKAGGYEVIQDMNGVVSISNAENKSICFYGSAYEAIREGVKEPAIRAELLKQWELDGAKVAYAEERTPLVATELGDVHEISKGAL